MRIEAVWLVQVFFGTRKQEITTLALNYITFYYPLEKNTSTNQSHLENSVLDPTQVTSKNESPCNVSLVEYIDIRPKTPL